MGVLLCRVGGPSDVASTRLTAWREGEGRFPLHELQACHTASRDGWRVRAPQGRWGWAIGRVSPGVRTAI